MNWFNNFISTPLIGVTYKSTRKEIKTLESFILDLDQAYNVNQTSIGKWICEKKGLQIKLELGNLVCLKKYVCGLKGVPGKLPSVVLPETKSYEELLEEVIETCNQTWKTLEQQEPLFNKKPVSRIGIVLELNMAYDDMPPGIKKILDAQNKLWGEKLDSFDFRFLTLIAKNEASSYKCHHAIKTLNIQETNEKSLFCYLDFQEYFDPDIELDHSRLSSKINILRNKALEYFDNFGKRGI